MNTRYHKLKGFSLVELLVVIAIIAALLAILSPSLLKAKLQAKILTVNQELKQIGLALEAYEFCNNSWPPARWDCMAQEHMYSLPPELVNGGYIPGSKGGLVHFSSIEDKFYSGHSYKYISVGKAFSQIGLRSPDRYLYIPCSFPANGNNQLVKYTDRKTCPVKWVIFSLGPGYDTQKIGKQGWQGFPIEQGFPVLQDFWYSQKAGAGILTRIKMLNHSDHIGTFGIGR